MKKVVGLVEKIKIIGKKNLTLLAKFDTGAKCNSIDKKIAEKIGLKTISTSKVKNVLGMERRRVVDVIFEIKGKRFVTKANIADRSKLEYPVLIGRNLIYGNFIVDVEKSNFSPNEKDLRNGKRLVIEND